LPKLSPKWARRVPRLPTEKNSLAEE